MRFLGNNKPHFGGVFLFKIQSNGELTMASPFRFNSTDFGPEQEGLVLHCFASQSDYFTQGEKYKVHYGKTGAYLISNCGMRIGQSSSSFMLPLPLPPKQPKVGEVWSFRHHSLGLFSDASLFYITNIEDGIVYHKRMSGRALYEDRTAVFLENHVFVF